MKTCRPTGRHFFDRCAPRRRVFTQTSNFLRHHHGKSGSGFASVAPPASRAHCSSGHREPVERHGASLGKVADGGRENHSDDTRPTRLPRVTSTIKPPSKSRLASIICMFMGTDLRGGCRRPSLRPLARRRNSVSPPTLKKYEGQTPIAYCLHHRAPDEYCQNIECVLSYFFAITADYRTSTIYIFSSVTKGAFIIHINDRHGRW